MRTKRYRISSKRTRRPGPNIPARPSSRRRSEISAKPKVALVETCVEESVVPYDENLLERAITQWQFGDWQSLAQMNRDNLQCHPDRAKLALLSAAGRLQTGNDVEARQFVRLAQNWGISRKLISQVLISGVHNSLGRVAAIGNQEQRALQHFENAITIGMPGSDARLLTQVRAGEQIARIGFTDTRVRNLALGITTTRNLITANLADKVRICMESKDMHEAIDRLAHSKTLSNNDLILFYIEVSKQFEKRNDKLTALHFLQTARDLLPQHDESFNTNLIKKFVSIGYSNIAADIVFHAAINANNLQLHESEINAIQVSYNKDRQILSAKSEHGHDLLLSYLRAHINEILSSATEKPLVIEIGTTRENVPGQGSTRKIAEFCKQHGLQFITVDMDPHNSRMASKMFSEIGAKFKAITMKGEVYLHDYPDTFDFIFLDAYDFDHGAHSELRQSRYKKYLGGPIDEIVCHQMHHECARSVLAKLSPNGVVCIDDTWLIDGKWTAKGTTAVPFLLENGFRVFEARNRAVLLARGRLEQEHVKI